MERADWGRLDQLPRIRLAHLPTPLEPLERLSRHLGGPRLLIKRDDCTGLAFGGNKARKLEWVLAEAVAAGADTLVTHGAIQSNHARQTAAAAAHLGLRCHLVLERRLARDDAAYNTSGNVLASGLLGATVELVPAGEADAAVSRAAGRLGSGCFVVPPGGANAAGSLGYVAGARELLQQAAAQRERVDWVVHVTGSASTHAGLLAGFAAARHGGRIMAVALRHDADAKRRRALALAHEAAALAGLEPARDADACVTEAYVGAGYGVVTPDVQDAIGLMARLEGILLDPVYSAKALLCLLKLVAGGWIGRHETAVLLHTGGTPALFAYAEDLYARTA